MRNKAIAMTLVVMLLTICLSSTALAITLKVGSTGDDVKTVQTVLKNEGYPVTVDGKYGETTKLYVKKYQAKYGLTADGIVGDETWALMTKKSEFPIKKGATGENVKKLQKVLIKHGYSLTADGKFGSGTQTYVKKYQAMHNLTADGIVGETTWKSMMGTLTTSKKPDESFPIKQGADGYDVLVIQTALKNHNLACGTDGVFDSNVTAKVKKYQSMHGLTADGKVGKDTWTSMVTSIKMPAKTFKKAVVDLSKSRFPVNSESDPDDIKLVQDALIELGYELDEGKYNSLTKTAVKDYQKKNDLTVSGFVDMDTWEALVATSTDKTNVKLLARIIKCESNTTDNGQLAVANTVIAYAAYMKRSITAELKSGRYSPCSDWDEFRARTYTAANLKNAKRAYYGLENPFGTIKPYYFHSKSYYPASGSWWNKLPMIGLLDSNVYYSK